MSLPTGTLLGPYAIQGVLGSGGMGEVYEALDTRLGRRVALKVLHPAFAADGEGLRRFEQEARATSALNHPNILTLHDLGTHEGAPFLVSELLEGETLRARMGGRPMSVGTALELALQVARGLAAAHGKGIVHRDLKPENLFLTRDGLVKILDFGIAKLRAPSPVPGVEGDTAGDLTAVSHAEGGLTVEGRILGTVRYMSPEQARSESLDGRSDLFSLGAVLWEMITGAHPFQRPTPVETLTALLKDDPPELDPALRIPPAVERLLRRCLAKPVGARFQTAPDLAFALEAVRGSGSEVGLPALPRRRWPSRRLLQGAVVGLGLLGLGVLAALALRPAPGQPTFRRVSFRQGLVYGARFSPDGREILYGASWSGDAWQVHVLPLDTLEERSIGPREAQLLAVSREGELALNLGIGARAWRFTYRGRLAMAPKMGAFTPKDAFSDVEWADYGPKGELAVVRIVENRYRLEYPAGTVIAESDGWISHPRISPRGDAVAFLDHPVLNDDLGAVCLWRPGDRAARRVTPVWQGGARGLAWKDDEVWFTAGMKTGMRGIWAVSLRGKVREVLQTPGDLLLQDVSGDGRVLLAREDTRQGLVFGTLGERAVQEYSLRDWTHLRSLSPDGQTVLFEELSEMGEQGYRSYLRRLDTRSTVRIGEGMLSALSPDQAWVATIQAMPAPHPVLLPVGPGEPRVLDAQGLRSFSGLSWTPEGDLLLVANEAGEAKRIFHLGRGGGRPRALTPAGLGIEWHELSPDGRTLLFGDHRQAFRTDLRRQDGAPEPLRGWEPEDRFIAWSADGREVFTYRFLEDPISVWRLDPATGVRRPWVALDLKAFPASALRDARITPDGRTWALRYRKVQTDLYLAEGLK